MHLLLIAFLLVAVASTSFAQRFSWVATGGAAGLSNSFFGARDIARDSKGNVYSFDHASLKQQTQGDTSSAFSGRYSTFLYKYDAQGKIIRTTVIGLDFRVIAIEVGEDDCVYALGSGREASLIIGTDTSVIVPFTNYLVKLTPDGQRVWHKVAYASAGNGELLTMLVYEKGMLFAQSGPTTVARFDTAGNKIKEISASHYKSQTAVTQLLFKGADVFSNGDVLFAAVSYGDVAFSDGDTLKPQNSAFLSVPILTMRCDTNLALKWYRYAADGLRNPDGDKIPVAVDVNDDVYIALQVNDTCRVGADSVMFASALAKYDQNGNGQWIRSLSPAVLPWALVAMNDRDGVLCVGEASAGSLIGGISLNGGNGKSFAAQFASSGSVVSASIIVTGSFGTAAQCITSDETGYIVGGKMRGGDGVPVFSCTPQARESGFYLGRFVNEPDSVPQPSVQQIGDSLVSTPPFTGNIQWFLNGEPIAGASRTSVRISTNGAYAVSYSYTTGCVGTATSSVIQVTTSDVSDVEGASGWLVHPNPFTDHIRIENLGAKSEIMVIDNTGRVIHRTFCYESTIDLPLTGLACGVYGLRICSNNLVSMRMIVRQ